MKIFLKLTLLGFLIFPAAASAVSPVMCKYLFHTDDRLSKSVRVFHSGNTDTTSLRQEVKYVVKTSDFDSYTHVLEGFFKTRFKNRDKAEDGFANITSTLYMTVAKYIQNGKKLSAKVRFRKYLSRKLGDNNWNNLIFSEKLTDRSWLELKIQHPEMANVVFKPRLLILDKDIEKLITEKYFDYKDTILRRLHETNPGKEADIKKFADFFDALYTTPAMRTENMYARTQYERTSYSIKLNNPEKPGETIDVQITLDTNIRLKRLKDGKDFNVYGPDETVVEVKIPVQYAKLTEADLQAIPELAEIKKLIAMLTEKHNIKYPANKGKMSKIDQKNEMENDPDLDWD